MPVSSKVVLAPKPNAWQIIVQWVGWWPPEKHYFLEPVNVTLDKRVFTCVIKLETLRWDYPRLHRWALNPITSTFIRERGANPGGGGSRGRTGEAGVVQPPAVGGGGTAVSPRASEEEERPLTHTCFHTSGLQNHKRIDLLFWVTPFVVVCDCRHRYQTQ